MRLISPATRLFNQQLAQAKLKENMKARRYVPFVRGEVWPLDPQPPQHPYTKTSRA